MDGEASGARERAVCTHRRIRLRNGHGVGMTESSKTLTGTLGKRDGVTGGKDALVTR